jgi:hypothetical protein
VRAYFEVVGKQRGKSNKLWKAFVDAGKRVTHD